MTKAPILVTAAVIWKDDHILIAQRKRNGKVEANKWEFPGGKVEHLEHPEAALCREIREELDLEIRVEKLLGVSSHIYAHSEGPIHIILLGYVCRWVAGDAKSIEVQDYKWVRAEELRQYEFAAADIPFIRALLVN